MTCGPTGKVIYLLSGRVETGRLKAQLADAEKQADVAEWGVTFIAIGSNVDPGTGNSREL